MTSLKIVSATFLLVYVLSLKESTCEARENVFYFTFRLESETNVRVHKDFCSARLCTQKSCTHVVVHWSKNISKNALLPGCIQIQIRTNP